MQKFLLCFFFSKVFKCYSFLTNSLLFHVFKLYLLVAVSSYVVHNSDYSLQIELKSKCAWSSAAMLSLHRCCRIIDFITVSHHMCQTCFNLSFPSILLHVAKPSPFRCLSTANRRVPPPRLFFEASICRILLPLVQLSL